jgi:branched-chain amino acid transport system substrate-binding protein
MTSKRFSPKHTALITLLSVVFLIGLVVPTAFSSEPIKIGASMSLTGKYARTGVYTKDGYELWAEQINNRGGLLGRKVEFVIYDDQSDPKTAAKLYEKLITSDKIDLLMGPYSSGVTFAASTITEKYKIPMITAGATSEEIWQRGYKYVFGTGPHNELYYIGAFDLAKQVHFKTIAIINADDLFPLSLAKAVEKLSKENGIEVVMKEDFPKGNQDFTALITKIKARNPDILFGGTYLPDSVLLMRQMKEQNFCPKMIVLSVGPSLPDFQEALEADANYVMVESFWEPAINTPGNKEFTEAYKKKFGYEPEYHGAWAYSGCQVLQAAIKEAASLEPEKVREALTKVHPTTLLAGEFKVDDSGMQVGQISMIAEWLDGKREVVWPEKYATKKFVLPVPAWNDRK